MAEVRTALLAPHFGSLHTCAQILFEFDIFKIGGFSKAWPTCIGVKFGVRGKQFSSARGAFVHSFLMRIPILAGKGLLGPLLLHHPVLLWRKFSLPFILHDTVVLSFVKTEGPSGLPVRDDYLATALWAALRESSRYEVRKTLSGKDNRE